MAETGPSKPTGYVIDDMMMTPTIGLTAGPQNPAEAHEYMDRLDMIIQQHG